jgi:hypothetical protein
MHHFLLQQKLVIWFKIVKVDAKLISFVFHSKNTYFFQHLDAYIFIVMKTTINIIFL